MVLKGFQGEARTQVMEFVLCCVVVGASRLSSPVAKNMCWQQPSYDSTEGMTSRRMIAATVLRELRLLGVINIATRRIAGEEAAISYRTGWEGTWMGALALFWFKTKEE